MELTVDQALQQGIAAHKEGKAQEAERFYRAILQSQPLHPDANHNLGVLAVSVNKTESALPLFKTALEANPKIEQFWLSYIDALIKAKQFENAKQVFEQAKQQGLAGEKFDALMAQLSPIPPTENANSASPSQLELNSLLEHYQKGRFSDAEKLALSITQRFPNHVFGWKVLAEVFRQKGRISEALIPGQKAVELDPQDSEVHSNLGITLHHSGKLEEAEASYKKAIALKPDFAEVHGNLAVTLQELGKLQEAEASYRQAIALNPNNAEAHSNLGVTLKDLGRLEEAEASYAQAVVLKPDYADAHYNLGNTLNELGRLEEAEASYTKAIALEPNNESYWNNIFFPVKALQFSRELHGKQTSSYKDALSADVLNNVHHDILEYRLAAFTPHLADDAFKKAINSLPVIAQEEILNPSSVSLNPEPPLPQKMIGLLHFGRSGTGLLHSLIDSHSEISTLPSIYFSEYFNDDIWKNLTANGWEDIAKRFVSRFEVLFDASSSAPIPQFNTIKNNLGQHEGMANVGPGRDEVLCVDRDRFCVQLRALMDCYPKLDPATFFTLVHVAYEATLDNPADKDTIFYHIHNPHHYTALNFLRYRPDARLVMMVRDLSLIHI